MKLCNIQMINCVYIGFGGEYFQYEEEENGINEDSKVDNKSSSDLQAYKTVLTSQSLEESLVINYYFN